MLAEGGSRRARGWGQEVVLFQQMALRLLGEVSWESSPPRHSISHAVAVSMAGGVSFSKRGKPEPRCKPISISLMCLPIGARGGHCPPPRESPSCAA